MTWTVQRIETDRVVLGMTGAELVRKPAGVPSAVGAAQAADKDIAEADMEVAFDKVGCLEEEDWDSVCSSDDSGGSSTSGVSDDEEEDEDASESEEEGLPPPARKAAGTHVYESNSYFTFIDNAAYPDIRCQALPRWCGKSHMGERNRSKTVSPAHYGDSRAAPTRARLVLRAWMLWKVRSTGFMQKRASRRRLFEAEAARLRADIIALSCASEPSTGNAAADTAIQQWAPQCMVPEK